MVGGLVEQQHVGLREQQLAQRDTAFFTSRQMLNHRFPRGQTQGIGRNFELVLAVVAASGGDDGLQLPLLGSQRVEVGVFFSVSGIHLFKALFGMQHFFHAAFHGLAHSLLGAQFGLLWQVANTQPGHGLSFALNFRVQTRHDFQQRGLARTVQAQHANLGTRKKAQ